MEHRLYKVLGKNDGIFGRFRFNNGVSEWLNKRDADHAIAAGVAVRCLGESAPYYAIMIVEAHESGIPLPENYSVNGTWEKPKGRFITSSNYKALKEQNTPKEKLKKNVRAGNSETVPEGSPGST